MLPMPYYAATGFPPMYQPLLPGAATPSNPAAAGGAVLQQQQPTAAQNGNSRPSTGRPPSPTGSQNGCVTPGPNPGSDAGLPNPPAYPMIQTYYDATKGTVVQVPVGAMPPGRLLPSPAPLLPPTYSTLSNPVNLGSPISSISGSNFGGNGRRDSLDRTSNPPFSPSLDFTKPKGGWGGGLTSYGAVGGSIASPGLAGLNGSTGSLTPPPINGLNLGLFAGVNNRLAPGADRTFALGAGAGLYPATRAPGLGANGMGPMGAMGVGALPFGSLITAPKSRHNSSNVEKNTNRSRMLEDFR